MSRVSATGSVLSLDERHHCLEVHLNFDDAGRITRFCEGGTRMKVDVDGTLESTPQIIEADERFYSVFMHMAEGVAIHEIIFDAAGRPVNYRILGVNPKYEHFTGLKPEQVIGKLADEVYSTPKPPYLAEFSAVAMTGNPLRIETRFEPLGRDYEISIAPMRYGYFATIFSDVTARKRQEQSLRENEWFLEQSQRAGRLGSYRFDVSTGTWVNSRALDEIFGIDASYPRTTEGWIGLLYPEDQQPMREYFANHVLTGGNPFDRRYRIIRHNDGEVRFIHGLGALEKGPDGTPHFMIGTIQDITESAVAEQALRAKTDELDHFFNLTPDMLCILSSGGLLLRINAEWERILGWSLDELQGHNALDFIHPEDRESTIQAGEKVTNGMSAVDFTNRYRCRDGSYRWFEWRSTPVENNLIYGAARDVTERKRLEQQLQQAQKLESIGRLAGGIAHDFNNLLTVIMTCSDSLLASEDQSSEARSDVLDIAHAARRAAELTRQLLAFSRQQVLQPRVVVLDEIVGAASRMLGRLLGEDVDLVVRVSGSGSPVFADPGQLERILVNLAVNARDAMPAGGRLTIEASTVELTDEFTAGQPDVISGPYVMLTVSDTGAGMDEATRARAFDPFFTTKSTKGTGLGLATVYGIVKQSGGHIWIQSEPGAGTTFKICLPRAEASLAASASRNPHTLDRGDETILLVEDEDQVRRTLERVLSMAGYRVLAAADGEEALRLCEHSTEPVHLLLTDVVMPKMTGRQLADRLALVKPIARVLYMSGYTPDAIVHHGVLDEGIEFIQKPLTPSGLLSKVREVLNG